MTHHMERGRPAGTTSRDLMATKSTAILSPRTVVSLPPRGYIVSADGERHRARGLSSSDRHGVALHVHLLRHEFGMGVDQIRGALRSQHELERSAESVEAYLSDWTCADCHSIGGAV